MSDKTKDSLLVISDNFRLTVRDFFFDGTFRWASYGSYGPCATRGGQAATGSTLLATNFSRRTTFVFRYVAIFFRYVRLSVRSYGFPSVRAKKTYELKAKDSLLVGPDNFCV